MNAIKYKGKANAKSTLGAVIQSNPQFFKSRITEIRPLINTSVAQVNNMTLEQQKARLYEIDPSSLQEPQKKKKTINVKLPNLDHFGDVTLRLAPYPSGPLHIGNSRMVVLNDYLAKKYKGKLYLVFDDTIGSKTKIIDPNAYDSIPEGLEFLDVKVHKTYYKSDRLELFYDYAVKILQKGSAYVCSCEGGTWRTTYKEDKKACPCRSLTIEDNLSRWEQMLDGTYPELGAAVRLKTEMDNPDPAIRDPVMLRISERNHPRVGSKYRVWPLLEFSWGIDDHELNISHIIRGKDLRKEGVLEERIWDVFQWKKPTIILYGRMKLKDLNLSKSKAAHKISSGDYTDWTDPRTWSLQSLRRRGIQPKAIKKSLLDIGMSPVDVTFSPEQIYSANRRLIDADAERYFLTVNPIVTTISNIPLDIHLAAPLLHPEFPERGTRTLSIVVKNQQTQVNLPGNDLEAVKKGHIVRLKDLLNITIKSKTNKGIIATFHSVDVDTARKNNAPMLQWTSVESNIPVDILMTNGTYIHGLAEPDLRKVHPGQIIQFERFAFCRVENVDSSIQLIWLHR